jgi:Zn finger protein HypA/HybF involved in hydrogenase expression
MSARLRRLVACEAGYSLVELLQVTAILSVVLGSLTAVFVSAMNSEVDMNRRFTSQQEARVAVDKMRRELHCASALTQTGPLSPTGASASITITLPSQCPSAGGTQINVVYDMLLVSAERYELRRAGVRIADYITDANAFKYAAPATGKLGTLHVDLPVNVRPSDTGKTWRLAADIVLRNTVRL